MTEGRRRVGVIGNPSSRAGRTDRARFGTAVAGLPHSEPTTRAELRDALRDFASRGVDLLAVQGGDGTLREALTALPAAYGDTPPDIAVLAAGKTNLAARVLGSAGMGEPALRRLLDAADRGALRRRALPVLEVARLGTGWEAPVPGERTSCAGARSEAAPGTGPERPDRASPAGHDPDPLRHDRGEAAFEGDEPPLRGVLFGAAAFTEGKRLADSRLHRRGLYDGAAVALALAGVALRAGRGRSGDALRAGVPMAVAPDDAPGREGRRFLLLATTLDRLMLGLRPFWGEGRGPVRWLDVLAPPRRLAAALWAGGRGKPRPWMGAAGYASGRAERLRVLTAAPFVLDGEVFEPGPRGLLLSAPAEVAFVSP